MSQAIYKYEVFTGDFLHYMHPIVEFLTVGSQDNKFFFWAIVDLSKPKVEYKFTTLGTGWEIDFSNKDYLGTVQDDLYVWHVFLRNE